MIGELGQALTPIGPGTTGRVAAHGEIWQAVAHETVPEGATVRITGVEGLLLTVRKEQR
jgi:membrane-bound ClpP family serine protease